MIVKDIFAKYKPQILAEIKHAFPHIDPCKLYDDLSFGNGGRFWYLLRNMARSGITTDQAIVKIENELKIKIGLGRNEQKEV